MIGVPMTANSVYVPMVQTGCCKAEFDSTYPIHLNGIIGQGEFRESIDKINHTVHFSGSRKIVTIIFIVTVVISMICFIFGGISARNYPYYGFPPLIAAGMALSIIGSIVFIIGLVVIQIRQTTRLRQVIAEESMKYSARSPTPCSWRLETTRYFNGYGNNNSNVTYHVIIDIGRPIGAPTGAYYSNQNATEGSYLVGQPNQYTPSPPPYSSSSTAYCSQCGATRPDLSARFCSSCGQAFNKY